VSGRHHAPAALPPVKSLCAYRMGDWLGLSAGIFGFGEKVSSPVRIRIRDHSVASRYPDHSTASPKRIRVTILVVTVRAVKACGEMEVRPYLFLTLAVQRGEWSASCPDRLTASDSSHSTRWIWVWVGPKGLSWCLGGELYLLPPPRIQHWLLQLPCL